MSGGSDKLSLKEEDVTKMLAATTHIGSTNTDFQMEQYIYKRRSDGTVLIQIISCILDLFSFNVLHFLSQVFTSSICAGPMRSCYWLPEPSFPLRTQLMCSSSLLVHRVSVLPSSLPHTPRLPRSPVVSLLVPSLTRSKLLSASLVCWLLWTHAPIISPSLKLRTSTSPSLLCATPTRLSATSILPFLATTR